MRDGNDQSIQSINDGAIVVSLHSLIFFPEGSSSTTSNIFKERVITHPKFLTLYSKGFSSIWDDKGLSNPNPNPKTTRTLPKPFLLRYKLKSATIIARPSESNNALPRFTLTRNYS